MKNPDSVLAKVPQKKCDFRYADLSYPAASGSFISFVSGGLLIPNPDSRGSVGGMISVVGQAGRGKRQGWTARTTISSTIASDTQIGTATTTGACDRQGGRTDSDRRIGLVS